MNFAKYLRTSFLQNTPRRLLLDICQERANQVKLGGAVTFMKYLASVVSLTFLLQALI